MTAQPAHVLAVLGNSPFNPTEIEGFVETKPWLGWRTRPAISGAPGTANTVTAVSAVSADGQSSKPDGPSAPKRQPSLLLCT